MQEMIVIVGVNGELCETPSRLYGLPKWHVFFHACYKRACAMCDKFGWIIKIITDNFVVAMRLVGTLAFSFQIMSRFLV